MVGGEIRSSEDEEGKYYRGREMGVGEDGFEVMKYQDGGEAARSLHRET